jgi:hypothetical protein
VGGWFEKLWHHYTSAPKFESISKHLRRVFGLPRREEYNDYAMIRSEEFVSQKHVLFHSGKTEEYRRRYYGSDIEQSFTVRLRDDCETPKRQPTS